MLRYALVILVSALITTLGCSKKSNTDEFLEVVSSSLTTKSSYHDFVEESVPQLGKEFLAIYSADPKKTCENLTNTAVETLLDSREVLEHVSNQVSCAKAQLQRIDEYYVNYRELSGSFYAMNVQPLTKSIASNAIALETASLMPNRSQLPRKVINLTFDDGPHPKYTEQILNALDMYKLKVNFFTMGKNIKLYPELLKLEAQRGHIVGGHSMTHADLSKMGLENAKKEILGVFDIIEETLGVAYPFFRFPYGAKTKALSAFVSQNNISEFSWNVDTLDWKYKNPDVLLKYALGQTLNTGRGIVLFHDIQPQTAAILPAYLDAIKNAGFETVYYTGQ